MYPGFLLSGARQKKEKMNTQTINEPKNQPKIKDIVRKYDTDGRSYWGVVNVVNPKNVVILWETGEYESIAVKDFKDTKWLN